MTERAHAAAGKAQRTAHVVLNSGSGSVSTDLEVRVVEAFKRARVLAEVRSATGENLASAIADCGDTDLVVVGGGDGSISAAAGVLAGSSKVLGVLPLGTLNHFARDLGVPLELEAAVQLIASGTAKVVDVAEVNGRIFVNNSSIGLYARAVAMREARQARHGWSKWPSMLIAMARVLTQLPKLNVRLRLPGQSARIKTALVFVGNNQYETSLAALGGRACMDRGHLGVYAARTSTLPGLLRLALHAAAGKLNEADDCEAFCVAEFSIESRHRHLRVACDGEVLRMQPPLRYRSRPRSLNVIAPR